MYPITHPKHQKFIKTNKHHTRHKNQILIPRQAHKRLEYMTFYALVEVHFDSYLKVDV